MTKKVIVKAMERALKSERSHPIGWRILQRSERRVYQKGGVVIKVGDTSFGRWQTEYEIKRLKALTDCKISTQHKNKRVIIKTPRFICHHKSRLAVAMEYIDGERLTHTQLKKVGLYKSKFRKRLRKLWKVGDIHSGNFIQTGKKTFYMVDLGYDPGGYDGD